MARESDYTMDALITIQEAVEINGTRGEAIDHVWIRKKAAAGQIEGAVKVGKGIEPRDLCLEPGPRATRKAAEEGLGKNNNLDVKLDGILAMLYVSP